MKYKYTVLVETEEEGGYHVSCPALPGCHSEGETIEEALTQIKEAIEVYLESLLAHAAMPSICAKTMGAVSWFRCTSAI